MKGVGINVAW